MVKAVRGPPRTSINTEGQPVSGTAEYNRDNMLKEIFAIPKDSPRYDETAMEIRDKLPNLIQKIECLLFTEKGSVYGMPDFGVNLEKYIFETNLNAGYIKNEIDFQIIKYVMSSEDSTYSVTSKVNFYDRTNAFSFMCVVDIYINNEIISSYVF